MEGPHYTHYGSLPACALRKGWQLGMAGQVADEIGVVLGNSEFSFVWVDLGAYQACQLKAFDEAWQDMSSYRILDELAVYADKSPEPADICAMLDRIGIPRNEVQEDKRFA